jgi:hypothetical protein
MLHRDPATPDGDERAIDALVRGFFGLFSNRGGVRPDLRALFELCIPETIISKCVSSAPEVMSLEAFIAPREALLSNGTLTDFEERETAHHTQVFGNVAVRSCTYTKSGVLNGVPFDARGAKVFQFIKGPRGWRISAVAWDDEREGFRLAPDFLTHFDAPKEMRTADDT